MAVNSIAKTDEPVFNHSQSRLIALNGMIFEHNVVDASEDVIRRTLEDIVFTALDDHSRTEVLCREDCEIADVAADVATPRASGHDPKKERGEIETFSMNMTKHSSRRVGWWRCLPL